MSAVTVGTDVTKITVTFFLSAPIYLVLYFRENVHHHLAHSAPELYKNMIFHDNVMNDALNIDLNIFCLSMIDAVEEWYDQIKNDPIFVENYKTFMKRYPNGLSPYIGGVPVIS
jgi:hypothetical protein